MAFEDLTFAEFNREEERKISQAFQKQEATEQLAGIEKQAG